MLMFAIVSDCSLAAGAQGEKVVGQRRYFLLDDRNVSTALNICADVKDGGSLRAEVVGVSGLSSGDSFPVTADVTDGVLTWDA